MRGIEVCVPTRSQHCGTQRIAHARNHAFYVDNILTRSDISYATTNEFAVATASVTSFLSSAIMYLWGQLSYRRRYCRRVFRVVISHFGSL